MVHNPKKRFNNQNDSTTKNRPQPKKNGPTIKNGPQPKKTV